MRPYIKPSIKIKNLECESLMASSVNVTGETSVGTVESQRPSDGAFGQAKSTNLWESSWSENDDEE
ncbi:hypothetical protein Prede_1027 [Prevotella dentalis DSM 3688]|uniref:Uncharacterized protein n=1 Tax=Prevotella dentalis (strain ATCC 49559 / DSM 3688 / JCM 13448 / NCTC 12043 / ES 2772) TaxID=908937 RepID=L0JAR9_PREDD|nr:hypothetical protein [Prevotella dentalis]AGB28364.1 hypothetical protein Prede_1027 [Prevotella dentalis DSM 3688]